MLALRSFGIPYSSLTREIDGLVRDFFPTSAERVMPLNLSEDGDRLVAECEVPGLRMEDLEITVHGRELTIVGRFRKADDRQELAIHRRERVTGEFSRTLGLPVDVDADKVEATLTNGVLTIVMPKVEAARARKIPVLAR